MSSRSQARISWLALLGAAVVFVSLPIVAPAAASRGSSLAAWIYLAFDPLCHQISERSFHLDGHAFAVCHRCFGLYVGAVIGLIVVPFWTSGRNYILEQPRRILIFIVPLALDWALVDLNQPSTRFLSGMLAAMPLAALVFIAHQQLTGRPAALQPGDACD